MKMDGKFSFVRFPGAPVLVLLYGPGRPHARAVRGWRFRVFVKHAHDVNEGQPMVDEEISDRECSLSLGVESRGFLIGTVSGALGLLHHCLQGLIRML
jgi:hypothetical protein